MVHVGIFLNSVDCEGRSSRTGSSCGNWTQNRSKHDV